MGGTACCRDGRCCGCCSLRAGALAIAILNLLVSIVGVVLVIYFSSRGGSVQWVRLAIHVIQLIFNCLLIHGIRKERKGFVMAWVWVMTIIVLGTVILCVIELVKRENPAGDHTPLVVLIASVLNGFFIIVVRSYGLSISDRRGEA
ncbi:uncharacterized protein LOC119579557 [Penaeus monodon]|uniref:uncharacterized protein LOC119579557 n=1 Tax=Penaeus monodon TaxID=6687 RepID=UPI0018A7C944|nr:uncharacterized protein LOC119579557 [Penaeus monodon]XP_037783405.1 uncharacterized protein LOC119579557 [Penaeus monodon]XP_047496994.1 uncharacterized protein LOC125044395 isoform X1 [Penaeus chinensis]